MTPSVRQPRLDDLTARFMARTAAEPCPFDTYEVEPHEALGGFRTDPRTGWAEVTGTAKRFGLVAELPAAPSDWTAYAALPTSPALPLAFGLFPQQVRDPLPLLTVADLTAYLPAAGRSPVLGFSGLRGWARKAAAGKSLAGVLAGAGLLAVLGDAADALAALAAAEARFTGAARVAWENQRAAVLWLAGRHAEAVAAWEALTDHPAAAFNLGVALLFLGRASEAVPALKVAADGLTGTGWGHLANMLLLVAQARG